MMRVMSLYVRSLLQRVAGGGELLLIGVARIGRRRFGLIDEVRDGVGARLARCEQAIRRGRVLRQRNALGGRHELVRRERDLFRRIDNVLLVAEVRLHLGERCDEHVVRRVKVVGIDKLGVLLRVLRRLHERIDGVRHVFCLRQQRLELALLQAGALRRREQLIQLLIEVTTESIDNLYITNGAKKKKSFTCFWQTSTTTNQSNLLRLGTDDGRRKRRCCVGGSVAVLLERLGLRQE